MFFVSFCLICFKELQGGVGMDMNRYLLTRMPDEVTPGKQQLPGSSVVPTQPKGAVPARVALFLTEKHGHTCSYVTELTEHMVPYQQEICPYLKKITCTGSAIELIHA